MRLIDADALKKEFPKDTDWEYPTNTNEYVCEKIDAQPTAQSEQKWIPCGERLPEKSGSYLVSGRWGSGKISVGDCEYSASDGYFHTAWNFDVHAWMSLPEPYKEGGADG